MVSQTVYLSVDQFSGLEAEHSRARRVDEVHQSVFAYSEDPFSD